MLVDSARLVFTCNLCGAENEAHLRSLGREAWSACCSITRWRALMHSLSVQLFGEALILPDFPRRPDIKGIGLGDFWQYADTLSDRLDFTVTHYHREPFLDITDPPSNWFRTADFVLASDVFEHVAPPVSAGFEGAYKLLKPGGFLLLTVPTDGVLSADEEFYPDLHDWRIEEERSSTAPAGQSRLPRPKTHGGDGEEGGVLSMRRFSPTALRRDLRVAGFTEIIEWTEPCLEFGIPETAPITSPDARVPDRRAAGDQGALSCRLAPAAPIRRQAVPPAPPLQLRASAATDSRHSGPASPHPRRSEPVLRCLGPRGG